jgi:hypothetical protein
MSADLMGNLRQIKRDNIWNNMLNRAWKIVPIVAFIIFISGMAITLASAQLDSISGQFEVTDSISDIGDADLSKIEDPIFNQDGLAIWQITPNSNYQYRDQLKFFAKLDKNSNNFAILQSGDDNNKALRGMIPSLYGDKNYALSATADEIHKCYEYTNCKTLIYAILIDAFNDLKAKSVISQAAALNMNPSYKCSFSDKIYILGYYIAAAEYDNNFLCFHNWPWGSGTDTCRYHPEFHGCEYSDGWVNVDISLNAENTKNYFIYGGIYNDNNEESRIAFDNAIWLQQINWGGKQDIKYGINDIPSKITLYGRKTWSVTSAITWMAINADSVSATGHITGDGPTYIDSDESPDVLQSIDLEKGPIEWNSAEQNQDLTFKSVNLTPKTGNTVFANNDAYVVLKVENKGTVNIPARNWNINLYFNDLWGISSDLVETLVTHQTTLVQERRLQVEFPEIPPGETTIQIPILLNMRDPIFYKDQYMAYADQLIACGNPVPQEADCTNSNHLAVKQIGIASNIRGDSAGCVWGVFNLALSHVVDTALESFEWLPECPGVEQFFENLGLFTGQVLQDCVTQEPDVSQYIMHCFDQLFALAQSCQEFEIPGLEKVLMIFNFIEEVYDMVDTAGECLSMINSWMAELTEINNLADNLYEMIIINNGTDVVVTNSAGKEIRIIGGSITNGIDNSRAFFIPDGEVILVAGDDDISLQITSTKSSSMEILCIGPKKPNSCANERFIIEANPGTILTTTYSSDVGYRPMSVDYDGNGDIDYYAYPDTWKKIDVDIKPGGCPNPINPKSKGVIPVAILGTNEFDVNNIDPETIMLGREGISEGVRPSKYSFEDESTPFEGRLCNCHDLGKDGYMDMILHFDTQQIVTKLELTEAAVSSIPLKITCNLKGDTSTLIGQDCAKIIYKSPKNTHDSRVQHIQERKAQITQRVKETRESAAQGRATSQPKSASCASCRANN